MLSIPQIFIPMEKSQVIRCLAFTRARDDSCQGSASHSLLVLLLHSHQLHHQGLWLLKGTKREDHGPSLACLRVQPTRWLLSSCIRRKICLCTGSLWVFGLEATCWTYYVTGVFFAFQTFALFHRYGGFHPWKYLTWFWDFSLLLLPTTKHVCDFTNTSNKGLPHLSNKCYL